MKMRNGLVAYSVDEGLALIELSNPSRAIEFMTERRLVDYDEAAAKGEDDSLADRLALERELQQRLFTSTDASEGLAAYTQKRKARLRRIVT